MFMLQTVNEKSVLKKLKYKKSISNFRHNFCTYYIVMRIKAVWGGGGGCYITTCIYIYIYITKFD